MASGGPGTGEPQTDTAPSPASPEARPPLRSSPPPTGSPSTRSPRSRCVVLDDPDAVPALVDGSPRARRSWASIPRPARSSLTTRELVGLSLAASPTEVWYLPFGHRPRGGELAAPTPVRNLPPIERRRARAAGGAAAGPRGAEGGSQHQVRLAGASPCRRRAGGRGVRLHARQLRARSRPPLARASTRSASSTSAAPCRPTPTHRRREGADPVRRGGDRGGRVLLRRRQRDGARAARALRARDRRDGDGAAAPRHRDAARPGAHRHGVGGDLGSTAAVFARLSAELSGDLRRLESEIAAVAGESLNLNSPRQLATILFEKQQLPVLKRTKTRPQHRCRRARAARRRWATSCRG